MAEVRGLPRNEKLGKGKPMNCRRLHQEIRLRKLRGASGTE